MKFYGCNEFNDEKIQANERPARTTDYTKKRSLRCNEIYSEAQLNIAKELGQTLINAFDSDKYTRKYLQEKEKELATHRELKLVTKDIQSASATFLSR